MFELVQDKEQKLIDSTLFLFTSPYYNLLKAQYDNGDFDNNTTNITVDFLIKVTMAEISRGVILDMNSSCDK